MNAFALPRLNTDFTIQQPDMGKAMLTGQAIQTGQMKNELMQREQQQSAAIENVLSGVQGLEGLTPEIQTKLFQKGGLAGLRIAAGIQNMRKEERVAADQSLVHGLAVADKTLPFFSFRDYPQQRAAALKVAPHLETFYPPAETFTDETDFKKWHIYSMGIRDSLKREPRQSWEEKKAEFDYKEGKKQEGRREIQGLRETEPDLEVPTLRVPKSATKGQPKATGKLANMEVVATKNGWDIYGNFEHFKQAAALVTAGQMIDADKQLARFYANAGKEFEGTGKGPEERSGWIKERVQQDVAGLKSLGGGGTSPQQTPPASALKEGEVRTFANGQKWALRNGQPVQVK